MQIYILQYQNGSIGRLISMEVDIYDTVKTIKKTIKSSYGIPIYKQAISLDDKPLCDQFMLKDYKIYNSATLYLTVLNGIVAVLRNLKCLN